MNQDEREELREDVIIMWGLSEDEGTTNLRQQQNNNPINMEDIVNETSRDVARCIYKMFRGEGTTFNQEQISPLFPNFFQIFQSVPEMTIDNISEEYQQFLMNNRNQLPGIFTNGERYIFNRWRELMGARRRYFIQVTHAGPQAGNARSKKGKAKGKKTQKRKTQGKKMKKEKKRKEKKTKRKKRGKN